MLTTDLYLDTDELSLLKDELKLLNLVRPRDALLIELALETGARESELINIHKSDINLKNKTVIIKTLKQKSKSKPKREIPILDEALWIRLLNYSNSIDGLLFPINSSRVRQIWYAARPPSITKSFHKLRHTFGRTRSLQCNQNIYVLQYLLGHQSIANTALYTNIDYTPEALRKIFNG